MTHPSSVVPMVGASGAISGVMGAYLLMFPRVRVFTMVPLGFMFTSVALPAWAMLVAAHEAHHFRPRNVGWS